MTLDTFLQFELLTIGFPAGEPASSSCSQSSCWAFREDGLPRAFGSNQA
jgi:hypothetical protein